MTLVPAAICVPLRNEEASLPALLAALAAQDVAGINAAAFFFLDGCSDRSERILDDAAASFPFQLHAGRGEARADANAGRARRAAMALGLAHAWSSPDGLLLSTDADSRPRPDWLRAALHGLRRADVVAGRLVRIAAERDGGQGRVERYFDRLHAIRRTLDPVAWDVAAGSHHGGGANMAFRPDVYAALGGFRPLPSGEDAALLDDASRAGFRVRRDPAMVVETSSRRDGRALGGLAAALRAIDRAGLPDVPHPQAAVWQYRAQAQARRVFAALSDPHAATRFGGLIGLSGDHVVGVARDCPNAEAFAMRVVPAAPGPTGLIRFDQAEQALATLEQCLCERAA